MGRAKTKPRHEEPIRLPLHALCTMCEHQWVAAYTPMNCYALAVLFKGACCPSCGAHGGAITIGPENDQ